MEFGQSREYSEEVAAQIDREVKALLEECYNKALTVLRENKERLDQLVDALLKHDTLSRAEFVALMETGEIPEGLGDDKPRAAAKIPVEPKAEPAPVDKPELPEDIISSQFREDDQT